MDRERPLFPDLREDLSGVAATPLVGTLEAETGFLEVDVFLAGAGFALATDLGAGAGFLATALETLTGGVAFLEAGLEAFTAGFLTGLGFLALVTGFLAGECFPEGFRDEEGLDFFFNVSRVMPKSRARKDR